MRYEDVRRSRGRAGLFLRLKVLGRLLARPREPVGPLSRLSDHQLRDIGLTGGLMGFERPADWWRFR